MFNKNANLLSKSILQDKNLTLREKFVFSRICLFDEFSESAKETAKHLGLKESAVMRAKRNLEQNGYIKCVKNNGRGKTYVVDKKGGKNGRG